jgi:succinoglycan biosynthesis protein ExoL
MKSIIFLVSNATQPRISKRINQYSDGWVTHMFYYVRNNYNKLNSIPKAHYSNFLGELNSALYLGRIPKYVKLYYQLRSTKCNVLYSFGIDLLIVAYFAKHKQAKIYYELGDIRQLKNKRLNQLFLYFLRSVIFKRVDKVIVTSNGFKSYVVNVYNVHESRVEVIENKTNYLSRHINLGLNSKTSPRDTLILGIIGYFRYENVVDFLKEYSNTDKLKTKILIYGHGEKLSKMLDYCDGENVIYKGQFSSERDLHTVYSEIHYSYVVYDNRSLNVRLALPNKLYESMFFKVPLIVSSDTYLAEQVDDLNIGISIQPGSVKELLRFLNSNEAVEMYYKFRNNMLKIDPKVYIQ